jgi:hypothetical protein
MLLIAIARYLDRARLQEVREGVSELEIQKLAYFLQVLGTPLRLMFTRGTYRPYPAGLGHVLDTLEGHYLTGIGDRSAPVTQLAPINPLPNSIEAAETALQGRTEVLRLIDSLLKLVDGFETPYSLELLATVHFASVQVPATAEPDELADRVVSWSLRKARMFTDKHVRVAASRLGSASYCRCPESSRPVTGSGRGRPRRGCRRRRGRARPRGWTRRSRRA